MAEANKTGAVGEKILLRAGSCSVTILPNLGGKIASIVVNGHELLQAPLAAYAPRTQTMAFDAGDGIDHDALGRHITDLLPVRRAHPSHPRISAFPFRSGAASGC